MNAEEARKFFAYGRWANGRLLEAVGELPVEELDRDVRSSFGSLRLTLRHLLFAERAWLRFWTEGSFGPDLAETDFPDLASLVAGWTTLEAEMDAFARELTDEKLVEPRSVEKDAYVLGELVQHCLNHSTHHRGQVTLMLRQLGRTPPNTGFRQFLTATRR